MDLRSSKSVAALAWWIASGGSALFAIASYAGERIEFSAPAFPLAVPLPDVEVRDPNKSGRSLDAPANIGGQEMAPAQGVMIIRPKHKEEDAWGGTTSILGEDKDKRSFDDWVTAPPESNLFTNKGNSAMPHGWDTKSSDDLLKRRSDTDFENGQSSSRFGSQLGFSRETGLDSDRNARDEDRYGRDSLTDQDTASLFKTFENSSMDKEKDSFSSAEFSTFKDEALSFNSIIHQPKANEPRRDSDFGRSTGLPAGFDNYTTFENSRGRLAGEQLGQQFGADQSLRAWEQLPTANRSMSRSSFGTAQVNPNRVLAPVRPVNLPFPKRPGDY